MFESAVLRGDLADEKEEEDEFKEVEKDEEEDDEFEDLTGVGVGGVVEKRLLCFIGVRVATGRGSSRWSISSRSRSPLETFVTVANVGVDVLLLLLIML